MINMYNKEMAKENVQIVAKFNRDQTVIMYIILLINSLSQGI